MRIITAGFTGLIIFGSTLGSSHLKAENIQRVEQQIDWTVANKAKQEDEARDAGGINKFRSAKVKPEVIGQTRLPVLVLGTGAVRAAPNVHTQGGAYASTYRLGSSSKLTVLGSRSAIKLDDKSELGGELTPTGDESYTIDLYEDGIDLNFTRFGAAYTLRLTCARLSDTNCTKKDFIVKAYESLINVGGSEK